MVICCNFAGGSYTRAAEADSQQLEDSCQTICGSCENWRFSAQATVSFESLAVLLNYGTIISQAVHAWVYLVIGSSVIL